MKPEPSHKACLSGMFEVWRNAQVVHLRLFHHCDLTSLHCLSMVFIHMLDGSRWFGSRPDANAFSPKIGLKINIPKPLRWRCLVQLPPPLK